MNEAPHPRTRVPDPRQGPGTIDPRPPLLRVLAPPQPSRAPRLRPERSDLKPGYSLWTRNLLSDRRPQPRPHQALHADADRHPLLRRARVLLHRVPVPQVENPLPHTPQMIGPFTATDGTILMLRCGVQQHRRVTRIPSVIWEASPTSGVPWVSTGCRGCETVPFCSVRPSPLSGSRGTLPRVL